VAKLNPAGVQNSSIPERIDLQGRGDSGSRQLPKLHNVPYIRVATAEPSSYSGVVLG